MIRRYDDTPRPDVRYRHRPGAYAVLPRGRAILVTRQSEPWPEFQLPGGGIDAGEGAVRALHREVLEETGWTITRPRRLGAFRRFVFMPDYDMWAEKVCHIYIAHPARRLGPPPEPGHAACWMPVEFAARHLAVSGDRDFVSKLFGGP